MGFFKHPCTDGCVNAAHRRGRSRFIFGPRSRGLAPTSKVTLCFTKLLEHILTRRQRSQVFNCPAVVPVLLIIISISGLGGVGACGGRAWRRAATRSPRRRAGGATIRGRSTSHGGTFHAMWIPDGSPERRALALEANFPEQAGNIVEACWQTPCPQMWARCLRGWAEQRAAGTTLQFVRGGGDHACLY